MLHSVQYLRAVAATVVVAFHAFINVNGEEASRNDFALQMLASGVDLFFVISGFIMVQSTSTKSLSPGEFLHARIVRVVPLYWLATAAAVAYAVLVAGNAMPPPGEIAMSLLFLSYTGANGEKGPVYNPGWTLNFEMFFYAVFAAALLVRRLRTRLLLVGIVMVLLVGLRPLVGSLGTAAKDWTSPLLIEFTLGVVIGWLHLRRRIPVPPLLIGLGVAGLAAAVIFNGFGMHRLVYAGVPCALVLAGMVALDDRVPRLRWLGLAGDASYSIYLSHSITLQVVGLALPMAGSPARGAVAVLVCVLVGIACYRLVEQPLLRRMRSFAAPRAVTA